MTIDTKNNWFFMKIQNRWACYLLSMALLSSISFVNQVHADSLKTVKPGRAGLSAERLQRLDTAMQARVESGATAGVVILVARNDKVAYEKAFGKASIEHDVAMQSDSLFRLYSMTKPITSVALLQLYERGEFQLNDPLSKYIPEFANLSVYIGEDEDGSIQTEALQRQPTIHDVFRHTAGFSYGLFGNTGVDLLYQENGIDYFKLNSLEHLIEKLSVTPLAYQPGTQWVYSYSHDIQAYLVEKISGQPFDDYVREHILQPLEMTDTVFGIPDELIERTVSNYGPASSGSGLTLVEDPREPLPKETAGLAGGYKRYTDIPWGGVSLLSTARDYARFGLMLLNGGELDGNRILSKKTVEFMAANHLPENINGISFAGPGSTGYGLGVSVLLDPAKDGNLGSIGAFGWSGAATTNAIFDPKENMVVIIMGQHMPYDGGFLAEVKTLVYQSIIE